MGVVSHCPGDAGYLGEDQDHAVSVAEEWGFETQRRGRDMWDKGTALQNFTTGGELTLDIQFALINPIYISTGNRTRQPWTRWLVPCIFT
jgi:hypothetical protein